MNEEQLFYWRKGLSEGKSGEREVIVRWLRMLDNESGDINRFLPTTLANWIEEEMHIIMVGDRKKT